MENINFIPANTLPVAEGDEVSVLCLENGEMKQKPASGLGGGGVTLVLHTTSNVNTNGEDIEAPTVEPVPVGTYDNIKNAILNGIPVNVIINNHFKRGDSDDSLEIESVSTMNAYQVDLYTTYFGAPEHIRIANEIALLNDDRIMFSYQFDEEFGG